LGLVSSLDERALVEPELATGAVVVGEHRLVLAATLPIRVRAELEGGEARVRADGVDGVLEPPDVDAVQSDAGHVCPLGAQASAANGRPVSQAAPALPARL